MAVFERGTPFAKTAIGANYTKIFQEINYRKCYQGSLTERERVQLGTYLYQRGGQRYN